MVEVQQLRDPLEGEPDCDPYSPVANPSPLIAGFTSFRFSSERCRNRLNRKLKGNGKDSRLLCGPRELGITGVGAVSGCRRGYVGRVCLRNVDVYNFGQFMLQVNCYLRI